jgi:hypothetical protein
MKLRNSLVAGVGFMILVGAGVFTPHVGYTAPPSPTANVNVVNTADNPVPTLAQGITSVAGNVNVTNTPTVNLAPGTTVALDNSTPVLVRSVDDAVRQIFQEQVEINMPVGSFGDNAVILTPAGKRVVIEHVSASGIDQGGEHLRYEVSTILRKDGVQVQSQHFLVSTRQGANLGVFTASQPMRVYGDPDTTIVLSANRARADATAAVTVTVSGYYVDVP